MKKISEHPSVRYVMGGRKYPEIPDGQNFVDIPGSVIAAFDDSAAIDEIDGALQTLGAVVEYTLIKNQVVIRFDAKKISNQQMIDKLLQMGKVRWAESNRLILAQRN